jgi:hypothetical protein
LQGIDSAIGIKMISKELIERVEFNVGQHVRQSKGYETESWINPLTPVDSVAAFAMAKALTEAQLFDYCVSVAPEGHVYGYFFERCFGAPVLSVHVDYPPRRCEVLDNLGPIRTRRVLILEDDVASGTTLRHVVTALGKYEPRSMDLYLGRPKDSQILEHVDPAIGTLYLAEDHLDQRRRDEYEEQFRQFFQSK